MRVETVTADITRPLRREVLRTPELADLPLGDGGPDAVHLGAFEGSRLVSCCWIDRQHGPSNQPAPWSDAEVVWVLGGMATVPHLQGTGAGRAVVETAERVARAEGATLMWCHARATARGFYARCGWSERGEAYLHNRLEHILMSKQLA